MAAKRPAHLGVLDGTRGKGDFLCAGMATKPEKKKGQKKPGQGKLRLEVSTKCPHKRCQKKKKQRTPTKVRRAQALTCRTRRGLGDYTTLQGNERKRKTSSGYTEGY